MAQNPASWSSFLPWMEYTHNTLFSAAMGMLPFMAPLGYQPPLFEFQEDEVAVPTVQANLCRCRSVCKQVRSALLHSTQQSQRQANRHHIPAPAYKPGQRVGLSTRDLPLQVGSQKLTHRFIGPFEIDHIINPSTVHLKLLPLIRVHSTFHFSRVKPVSVSGLVPPSSPHLPPVSSISGGLGGVWSGGADMYSPPEYLG